MSADSLISDDYRALNAELHQLNPAYGVSGKYFAPVVEQVAKIVRSWSILDYGCGKRTLMAALGRSIANYDPCLPGYDKLPEPADIVVCTEVLEHIEPDHLDKVLAHLLLLTRKVVVLTVACGPASKILPDGRNAHLIQEQPLWWKDRLEAFFTPRRVFPLPSGFCFIGQPIGHDEIEQLAKVEPPKRINRTVDVSSTYSGEKRCTNIRSALLRCLPEVKVLPEHRNRAIICGYGPSLNETVRNLDPSKGDVYTVSGAHRVLIDRGIVPMGHIESDPRPHKAKCFEPADPRVVYFLASACHPSTFNATNGCERWVFHVTSSTVETKLISEMRGVGAFTVDGGTNVGVTALSFLTVLGYREFECHGMDCSFEVLDLNLLTWPNGRPWPKDVRERVRFHAGAHPNEDQPLFRVWAGKRAFISSPQMFQSVQDFLMFRSLARHLKITLRGDGFLQNIVRCLDDHERPGRAA